MILMAFVFPLELLAAIFAFLARGTLGATMLGLFTTSWLALGWLELSSPPGSTAVTIGIYLFGFSMAVLLLAVGGGRELYRISGGFALALTVLAMHGGVALGSRTRVSVSCCRSSAAAAPPGLSRASRRSWSGSRPSRACASSSERPGRSARARYTVADTGSRGGDGSERGGRQ